MELIKFYADWCNPCKIMTDLLEKGDIGIKIREFNIENLGDVDQFVADLASGVSSIPAMFLVDDNKVLHRWNGVTPVYLIKNAIKKFSIKEDEEYYVLARRVSNSVLSMIMINEESPWLFTSNEEAEEKAKEAPKKDVIVIKIKKKDL